MSKKNAAVGAISIKKKPLKLRLRNATGLYLLLAFPFIYKVIFSYFPMYGVIIAFKNYSMRKGIMGSPWANPWYYQFQRFFNSPVAVEAVTNTLKITLYGWLSGLPLSITLALLLNYMPSRGLKRTTQMVSFAPHFISSVLIVGLVNLIFSTESGLVNQIIKAVGGQSVNFVGNPKLFRHLYVWSGHWQAIGYGSIIYIAALAGVDPEMHEAAIIDGATILKRIRYIDLPTIAPTFIILTILSVGGFLSTGFEKIYLMQNDMNLSVTQTIDTYVYNVGLASARPDQSFGTAIGLFQNVVGIILTLAVNFLSKAVTGESFM